MHDMLELDNTACLPSTRNWKIIIIFTFVVVTVIIIVIVFTVFICIFMYHRDHTDDSTTVSFLSFLLSRFTAKMHCLLCDIFQECRLQRKY
jgi:hypothetical protein